MHAPPLAHVLALLTLLPPLALFGAAAPIALLARRPLDEGTISSPLGGAPAIDRLEGLLRPQDTGDVFQRAPAGLAQT
ncbi:hypothetical protein PsYK624_118970 [Phanerochaete sordida]|uniref:Uncharacterized protein n=1 Tax=Phanerochaete sordida TaxID=48140 RepID=A0A9P3LHN2_9APHY|nr:hypothetical protein PsYK624_118970 [Phanerochaete sordida]